MPIGKSVVSPRSSCGTCNHVLSGLDMIPVLSYVFSGGKCRYCHEKYSSRYMFIEILTAFLFVLSYLRFGLSIEVVFGIVLSSIVIIVTFIDIDHHIILNRFTVILIAVAIPYHLLITEISLLNAFLGFIVGGGILFVLALIGTMGGGDIKIMAGYGLILGFPNVLMAIYLSFILGALILSPGLIYHKIKGKAYNSKVAFGPFLSLGALITYLYVDEIYNMYLNIFL